MVFKDSIEERSTLKATQTFRSSLGIVSVMQVASRSSELFCSTSLWVQIKQTTQVVLLIIKLLLSALGLPFILQLTSLCICSTHHSTNGSICRKSVFLDFLNYFEFLTKIVHAEKICMSLTYWHFDCSMTLFYNFK